MRYAFFGTPPFAARLLELLLEAGLRPEFVVTQPDAASRRGSTLWPSAVAEVAEREGLALEKPEKGRDSEFAARLNALHLDCVVVAAYGRIITPALLQISQQGWINVHTSLLPRWRGAAPIQRALLAGDEATGVSIMRMEEGLDVGSYCAQAQVAIGDQDLAQLEDTLATMSAELLISELPKIIDGTATWQHQDEEQATYAQKIGKRELDLSPELSAEINVRKVRASSDSAPARLTLISGNREIPLRVLDAELWPLAATQDSRAPGAVTIESDRLALISSSTDTCCVISQLQPAGKRPQPAADFLRGLRLDPEEPLSWQ